MRSSFPVRAARLASSGAWIAGLIAILCLAAPVSAHPERVGGLLLSVLPVQREVVVRVDEPRGAQATALYHLSSRVDVASLRVGQRVVGLVDDDSLPLTIDELRIVQQTVAPLSAVHIVVPLSVSDQMPPTPFIDQLGRPFTFADFRGQYVVLTFIYTRCRDLNECPLLSSHFAVLQRRFAGGPYHLVEMTLDPAFDTPSILKKYAARYGADPRRWTFGTGNPQVVLDFDRRFGIDPFADPRVGLIHTERTVLIDPKGYVIDFIDLAGWNPDDIVARLRPSHSPSTVLDLLDFYLSRATVAICGNGATGFNGIEDLAIILAILGAVGYVLLRVARFIFAK